jgi:hypothetical protein
MGQKHIENALKNILINVVGEGRKIKNIFTDSTS